MQKMIFSAVALVVFSFAGMANEINSKSSDYDPCVTHAQSAYRDSVLNTGSEIYAELKYEQAKSECEEAIKNVKAVFDSIIR